MEMGQVWSKASFDGLNATGHLGGHGSVLAVTAQNSGLDGLFETPDDVLAPLNQTPIDISIDAAAGADCQDSMDPVRGFYSFHSGGSNFLLGDGSVLLVDEGISAPIYRAQSTIAGNEIISAGN